MSELEARILNELSELKRKIHELQQEQATLERMLLRVRRTGVGPSSVSRRDSVNKLIIEQELLEALSSAREKPVSTATLIERATKIDHTMKAATVRSYLNRMKSRNLIENRSHGFWRLKDIEKLDKQ